MHLFERATESGVVYGSKAVGEPPLMEAFSVREALRRPRSAFGPAGLLGRPGQPGHPGGGLLGDRGGSGRGRRRERLGRSTSGRHLGAGVGGRLMDWLDALSQLRREGSPGGAGHGVKVRGHAPREAGAKMVVGSEHSWGSVGGGNLEESAIRRARELIAAGSTEPETQLFRLNEHARNRARPPMLRRRGDAAARTVAGPARPSRSSAWAMSATSLPASCPGWNSAWNWSTPGADQLDPLRLADVTDGAADVTAHHVLLGEQVLERLPRGCARADHEPRPRGGLRPVRRRAAPAAAGVDRADRFVGEVVRLPSSPGRCRPPDRRDQPDPLSRSAFPRSAASSRR